MKDTQSKEETIVKELRDIAVEARKKININSYLLEAISFRKELISLIKGVIIKLSSLQNTEIKHLIKDELIQTKKYLGDKLSERNLKYIKNKEKFLQLYQQCLDLSEQKNDELLKAKDYQFILQNEFISKQIEIRNLKRKLTNTSQINFFLKYQDFKSFNVPLEVKKNEKEVDKELEREKSESESKLYSACKNFNKFQRKCINLKKRIVELTKENKKIIREIKMNKRKHSRKKIEKKDNSSGSFTEVLEDNEGNLVINKSNHSIQNDSEKFIDYIEDLDSDSDDGLDYKILYNDTLNTIQEKTSKISIPKLDLKQIEYNMPKYDNEVKLSRNFSSDSYSLKSQIKRKIFEFKSLKTLIESKKRKIKNYEKKLKDINKFTIINCDGKNLEEIIEYITTRNSSPFKKRKSNNNNS